MQQPEWVQHDARVRVHRAGGAHSLGGRHVAKTANDPTPALPGQPEETPEVRRKHAKLITTLGLSIIALGVALLLAPWVSSGLFLLVAGAMFAAFGVWMLRGGADGLMETRSGAPVSRLGAFVFAGAGVFAMVWGVVQLQAGTVRVVVQPAEVVKIRSGGHPRSVSYRVYDADGNEYRADGAVAGGLVRGRSYDCVADVPTLSSHPKLLRCRATR